MFLVQPQRQNRATFLRTHDNDHDYGDFGGDDGDDDNDDDQCNVYGLGPKGCDTYTSYLSLISIDRIFGKNIHPKSVLLK